MRKCLTFGAGRDTVPRNTFRFDNLCVIVPCGDTGVDTVPKIGEGDGEMVALRPTDEHAQAADDAPLDTHPALKRRGLIAGAAALAAGAFAMRTASPVDAAPLVGTNNFPGGPDPNADGVQGYAAGAANAGVSGRNNDLNGVGVQGTAPSGIGVSGGSANGPGVSGTSANGIGVYGQSTNSHGVVGITYKANYVAVYGATNATPGAWAGYFSGAVVVGATDNHGLQANSTIYDGVVGTTSAPGYAGVVGQATATGGIGVAGIAYAPAVTAGYFTGDVVVTGSQTVYGAKSAAVAHPDGTHRLLYAVEAPESWFEDVGQANLTGGKAAIALDHDFAATVLTSNYHVFLTPYGDSKGLFVTNKTATGFTVQEQQGGASTLAFSWRVMAKRKDITGERLAKVDAPAVPTPVQAAMVAPVPGLEPPPTFPTIVTNGATPVAAPSAPASRRRNPRHRHRRRRAPQRRYPPASRRARQRAAPRPPQPVPLPRLPHQRP